MKNRVLIYLFKDGGKYIVGWVWHYDCKNSAKAYSTKSNAQRSWRNYAKKHKIKNWQYV